MSAVSCLLTEGQFLCSICLDVFTDPVTIPCGHNFCKTCITKHWVTDVPYQCPSCREGFKRKPELQVNTFISEMAAQFRQSAQQEASSSSSEQQLPGPKEVPRDVYSGSNRRTWMFFLLCLMGVFMAWMVSDQKKHLVGPLKEEYEAKKAELWKTGAEILQMIQKRRLKIQEIKHSVELSDEDADREIAEGVQVFTALKESVERSLAELIKTIKEKQRTTKQPAEGFISELEQEISDLQKRSTEVEQLLQSEDQQHLLQSFTSLNAVPPTKDWTEVNIRPPSYEGTVRRAVTHLEEMLCEQMKKKLFHVELMRVQQSAVDVTLDPDTAHPKLILSDDGKQVKHGDVWKNLPDNPERFDNCVVVLAKQSLSSGRFYYEVQVKGKTAWTLGVARESVNRKGEITLTPQNGYWTIVLRNDNEYTAADGPAVLLSLKSRPQKVGVFVDYEEGLVSFYDVDAAALIYSFTGCSFTEKLYPYFSPEPNYGGKNSAPLIISPVSQ
ncbi:E3 ubiquitin-protein ligase TRIM21-like [Perca flavescens]|uniref:E3 ubiquitin-protein ligase TRIM21-like n=1 Tax=Perca flavescens TaxID=8167 RepID=UPI00106E1D68|nr:E3 ubiquitin-protein ligase TRIM21-like [Perca flavescens]